MAEFKLPELGENVEEGEVVSILVKEGDTLSGDQSILELETGKATLEVPCEQKGTVEKILVSEGDTIKVGQPVLEIGEESSESGDDKSSEEASADADSDTEADSVTDSDTPDNKAATEETAPKEQEQAQEPESESDGSPVEREYRIPDLGENVEEGEVISILVDKGDEVKAEQAVLEVETGKATVEIPVSFSGTVTEILVSEGGKVKPNQAVLKLETKDEAPAPSSSASQDESSEKDEETSKASEDEDPTPMRGQAPSKDAPAPAPAPMPARRKGVPVRAAPSVRRFAREIGVDIHEVNPSTEGDRLSIEDVKRHAKDQLKGMRTGGGGVAAPPLPDFKQWGEINVESMSTIRKVTAQHMAACWSTIPHVTQNEKADISKLEEWRKVQNKKGDVKLTLTAILLKHAATLLKEFRNFNASLDVEDQSIIYKQYVHIGVAVDTPKGLLVPVIRDVDQKSLSELAEELNETASKTRDGKIDPARLQGGTFTITNLGGIGGGHFTPIVNYPEAAILGIGRGTVEPVFENGAFAPRLMMPMSLSYDHRLIDGADGARFVTALKSLLEYPMSL